MRRAGCVFAEEEAALLLAAPTTSPVGLEALVARRLAGEPLEQVLGWAEFCGLRLTVAPGVFVPRARTTALVASAVAALRALSHPRVLVDLCCGCGAVGAAAAAAVPGTDVTAVDIDPAAVSCARKNVHPVGGTALLGNLYAPLAAELRGRVDVVVANAPYVPTAEIAFLPREARLAERPAALDGGVDGLAVQRQVAAPSTSWLAPGGVLLLESAPVLAEATAGLLTAAGLIDVRVTTDDDTGGTAVQGRKPA